MSVRFEEFYGFTVEGDDYAVHKNINEQLRKTTDDGIYEGDTGADVVEEIVRRGGDFYDGKTAKKFAPFKIKHQDIYLARFRYLENEERPENPNYAVYDWVTLYPGQYAYGKYLQRMIENGLLTIEDIKERHPGRPRVTF